MPIEVSMLHQSIEYGLGCDNPWSVNFREGPAIDGQEMSLVGAERKRRKKRRWLFSRSDR